MTTEQTQNYRKTIDNMKKFYTTLLAAAMILPIQARELTFYNGDTPIANGSTVYFNDIEVEKDGGITIVYMEPALSIGTDLFAADIVVTATCTSGQTIQMCCGGLCSAGETVTKTGVTVQTDARLPLQFDYITELDEGQDIPTVTTVFEATCADGSVTPVKFTLVMTDPAGVTSATAAESTLRSVAGALEYDVEGSAEFTLSALDGSTVYNATLSGSGSIATGNLSPGIYVYSLGAKTGKITIR